MTMKLSDKELDLEPIEWDPPVTSIAAATARKPARAPDPARPGAAIDAASGTIPSPKAPVLNVRDRYIAARFSPLASCGADLENVERVIEGARLYFDELETDRALPLLGLAVEQCPDTDKLRHRRPPYALLPGRS